MSKLKRFNTKATKLSTAGVREMYERLKRGEINQGQAARIYGLGVIQVGRIARGESRAAETGANGDEIENTQLQPTTREIDESKAKLVARLDGGGPPPSLMDRPPTEDEDNAVAERTVERLNEELKPTFREQQVSDELSKLEKGD